MEDTRKDLHRVVFEAVFAISASLTVRIGACLYQNLMLLVYHVILQVISDSLGVMRVLLFVFSELLG